MKRIHALLLLVALVFVPSSLFGQTATPRVLVNQPIKIEVKHDGKNTDVLRMRVDGVTKEDKPVTALVGGVLTFDVPGIATAGAHTVSVSAVNAFVERTGALSIAVVSPDDPSVPSAPTLKLIIEVVVTKAP